MGQIRENRQILNNNRKNNMTDFTPSETTFEHRPRSVVVDFFSRLFREKLLGTIGLVILLFMVIVAPASRPAVSRASSGHAH